MNHGQYIQMTGLFQFSLTTSATPENQNVRQLYESFGFQPAVYRQIDGLPYVTMRAVGTQVMRAINDYQFSK
jgi:hypothetical protein